MKFAIEKNFPFESIDRIAEIESYRKEINRPIYHIHKWWAKRLGSVFRSIISGSLSENDWPDFYQKQNFKGKIVLDPFMGSGTTLGEAIKLGANVIGCDVNPVSTFIVTQSLTNVDISRLHQYFSKIENDIKDQILGYYTTKLPTTGEIVPALYYFWVKVVKTPSGEEIPLFTSYVFSKNAYASKKPESQILCPSCGDILVGKYNATSVQCSSCNHTFNPQAGPVQGANVTTRNGIKYKIKQLISCDNGAPKHRLYAVMALSPSGEKIYIKPSEYDFELLASAEADFEKIKNYLPLPTMEVRPGHNTNQARGYNYNSWSDFFSTRQLLCLGLLLKEILKIDDKVIRDHFICLFSGTLEFNNLFCSFKGEGTGAVRHLFSNHILKPERTPLENTVWGIDGKSSGTFSSLFKSRLIKAKKYLEEPFEIKLSSDAERLASNKVVCSDPMDITFVKTFDGFSSCSSNSSAMILNGDSASLPIPDMVVDAIITDPPYFDFVHYSELSDFFYAWIKNAVSVDYPYLNRNDSSHENEVQDKDNVKFSKKINAVFRECYRVLKHDGLLCFSYHHSTDDGWMAIYDAIVDAGFYITAAHPVKAEMSVAAPKSITKEPINIDAILVCKKQQLPPVINDPEVEIHSKVQGYLNRFNSINRKISAGDRFVIICSQVISVASCIKMSNGDTKELLHKSLNKLL
ncbi:DNA methyltransferase [Aeromonas sp. 75A]|uniref:DNA methyltransferase n=1 Tax=unclassified Aeromonas TaxID=257493 RepID=UPI002E7B57F2|nr:DNA methyltransferase [Aeromonas sp. 43P]MEE1953581.1 DNA methyltransferase [Aeromonas sp. 43P]